MGGLLFGPNIAMSVGHRLQKVIKQKGKTEQAS
jgi:hypothetical protein